MDNVHRHSSFKHSCIHPPRHPKSRQPSPHFERHTRGGGQQQQRGSTGASATAAACRRDEVSQAADQGGFVHELGSKRGPARYGGAGLMNEDSDDDDDDLFNTGKKSLNIIHAFERENSQFRSMSDFYDSIPDYNDLHHLSESEFYSRLERLKIQQQELMDLVGATEPSTTQAAMRGNKMDSGGPHPNKVVATAEPRKELMSRADENNQEEDCNSMTSPPSGFVDDHAKPPPPHRPTSSVGKTKKSVRISSGTTYRTDDLSDFNDCEEFIDERLRLNVTNTRSKSASPRRTKASSSSLTTVPRPFKMTQRWGQQQTFITRKSEEEDKMMDDLANSSKYLSKISLNFDDYQPESSTRLKVKPFKANPVPLTSRIPLYEHIKEDHRRRSTLAKLNSAIELQAQIKPFKFNGGDRSESRCLSRTASTPNLDSALEQQHRPGSFKANPCPKRLFSNYFYNKMWEDEYFRALNRKIRAEEMLKISRLPPSMAKRNDSFQSEFELASKTHKRRRKRKCRKSSQKNNNSSKRSSSGIPSNSSIVSSSCGTTPIPTYPVNRPNLAATLRVQSSRQKVRELSKPKSLVPENRLTSTSRCSQNKNGWGVRKSLAWKSMNYDPTNLEDIAIRVATRKAEQKLRQEEHEMSMELMKERVRAAPLLLEGPTYWGPKVGQLSHRCRSTEEISSPSRTHQSTSKCRRRQNHTSSKLSFYSMDDQQKG